MKLIDLIESFKVYRGITTKNLPKRYPGKYYTELYDLAKWYAKEGGSIEELDASQLKPFNIEKLNNDKFKKTISIKFNQFMTTYYPEIDPETTQLYDNLNDPNITDFSYPTKIDVEFLKSLGYDSVTFEVEGGQVVKSWFVFD